MKENVNRYFLRQIRAFERNFAKTRDAFDIEAIHQMRLSVKRTKALFQFLEVVDFGKFDAKKEFRLLKHLFKLSGNIRDVQVQSEIVLKMANDMGYDFSAYLLYLDKKEKEAIEKFNDELKSALGHGSVFDHNRIQDSIDRLSRKRNTRIRTIRLLNLKIGLIDELRKDLSTDAKVHKIRIYLKQIHYIFDFTHKYLDRRLFLKMPMTRLKKIENVFGKWHDYVNGLNFIQQYLLEAPSGEKDILESLAERFDAEKAALYEQIRLIVGRELLFTYVLEI